MKKENSAHIMDKYFYPYGNGARVLIIVCLLLSPLEVQALEPEPHPLDTFLTNILNFKDPTGIRGTLRFLDLEEETIWLNWEYRSDDRPLFHGGWKPVPGEACCVLL